jgi:hypothetical protein
MHSADPLPISIHCLRRYIERVIGYEPRKPTGDDYVFVRQFTSETGVHLRDLNRAIESEVLAGVPRKVLHTGSRRVVRGSRCRYVVSSGTVVTCYRGDEMEPAE